MEAKMPKQVVFEKNLSAQFLRGTADGAADDHVYVRAASETDDGTVVLAGSAEAFDAGVNDNEVVTLARLVTERAAIDSALSAEATARAAADAAEITARNAAIAAAITAHENGPLHAGGGGSAATAGSSQYHSITGATYTLPAGPTASGHWKGQGEVAGGTNFNGGTITDHSGTGNGVTFAFEGNPGENLAFSGATIQGNLTMHWHS